jgi:hypothetical protein
MNRILVRNKTEWGLDQASDRLLALFDLFYL